MSKAKATQRRGNPALAGQLTILAVLTSLAFAGCLDAGPPSTRPPKQTLENTVPLEITYIRIAEKQQATNAPFLQYTGTVDLPYCLRNPNPSEVMAQDGYEVYQVLGPPGSPDLRLVQRWDSGVDPFPGGWISVPLGMSHAVLMNETLEGNSTDYAIHIWHQILLPEPLHREDRWFNMTFIPYHPGFTVYEEGTPC